MTPWTVHPPLAVGHRPASQALRAVAGRRRWPARLASWWLLAALTACGGGGSGQDPATIGWDPLIERSWTLGPLVEDFRCRRIRIDQDTYVSAFRALAPAGTHRMHLSLSSTATPLGDYDCNLAVLNQEQMVFGGGAAGATTSSFRPASRSSCRRGATSI